MTVAATNGSANAALGVSMPTNPARPQAPAFVVAAGGVLNRNGFSHVLVNWTASGAQIFVNGSLVAEQAVTIVPFTVRFIDLGTSQQLANVMRGSIDEMRASNSVRSQGFARAEAKSTLNQLVTAGPVEAR